MTVEGDPMNDSRPKRRHASKWSLVVGLVILVAVAMSCRANGGDTSPRAVDVDLVTMNGDSTSISGVLGVRPLLASLWAVWCQPCRRELPELQRIAVSDAGVDVLAVNIGDDPDRIGEYFEEMDLDLPLVIDEVGDLLTVLDVGTVPATVLFGADGEILWSHLGAVTAAQVEEALATYVA
ncbi:MAG: TlpA family protein disulfide reductase [Actinomycetota bacterium]